MYAFHTYVFTSQLQLPLADSMDKFLAQNSWVAGRKVRLIKPKFAIGDRVVCRVGTVPNKHNAGYLLEDGIGTIKHVMVLDGSIGADHINTRALYLIEFDRPVEWIDVDSGWKATEVVVQESKLMERVQ